MKKTKVIKRMIIAYLFAALLISILVSVGAMIFGPLLLAIFFNPWWLVLYILTLPAFVMIINIMYGGK